MYKKNLKSFGEYNESIFGRLNKLPDFEFESKVKKIIIDLEGDKVVALAGASNVFEEENGSISFLPVNSFYFKTDKENTKILKKHDIKEISEIDPDDGVITFTKNNGEEIDCYFRVKWFSSSELKWNRGVKDGEFVTWKI